VTTSLFGLELDGDIDPADVPTAAVVVVELISAETSKPYLRLMSSGLSTWQRLGMLRCVVASDEADAVRAFVPDDEDE
jgi:hypothetical protein